jgi:serine/threonine-protein phosphatase 2A regulatory subunit B'
MASVKKMLKGLTRFGKKDEKKTDNKTASPVGPTPVAEPAGPKQLTELDILEPIATLASVQGANKTTLFIHKLRLCAMVFEWGLPESVEPNNVKRDQLLELVDFIGKGKIIFTEEVLVEVFNMLSANLFRPLPPPMAKDTEEDEPVREPSWPYLSSVYEFFLRFILSGDVDPKSLKQYIDSPFILRVIALFNSEDAQEREYLKSILHRIYAKFMNLRAFIRKAMNNVFLSIVNDGVHHNGIAELLEIIGSIINGFADPIKQEHKVFLATVLVPMHKASDVASFHSQLAYCVNQFVDKDSKLAPLVIGGVLKYWPKTSSAKELLFISELEDLLELTKPPEFAEILEPVCQIVLRAVGSPHFQIAEKALFLWHAQNTCAHFINNRSQVLPILYPTLSQVEGKHWNAGVSNLMQNVLKLFTDKDSALVQLLADQYSQAKANKHQTRSEKVCTTAALT